MLQIISAVIKDSEDKTNISLLFANQVWVIFHSFLNLLTIKGMHKSLDYLCC